MRGKQLKKMSIKDSFYYLSIADAALEDIRQAYLWYEEEKPGLGKILEDYLSKAIEDIKKNPLKIQKRYNSIRVYFLRKFPFGIHFSIEQKEILILAVFHTSKDPQKWNKQKK